jgi:hypothetical protein
LTKEVQEWQWCKKQKRGSNFQDLDYRPFKL